MGDFSERCDVTEDQTEGRCLKQAILYDLLLVKSLLSLLPFEID